MSLSTSFEPTSLRDIQIEAPSSYETRRSVTLVHEVPPVAYDITELIGHTPLIELGQIAKGNPEILVKHEGMNPGGSIRDRTVLEILDMAAASGLLQRGDEVVLAGATNSALAAMVIGNCRGYRTVVFHPKQGSKRLLRLLRQSGAKVKLLPGNDMDAAVEAAASYARETSGRIFIDAGRREVLQDAVRHIAREILEALDGQSVGAFVTSYSTGATLRHVARELRHQYPELLVLGVRVDPAHNAASFYNDVSPSVTTEMTPLRGVRAETMLMNEREAWLARAYIARSEGLLLGPKGAAAVLGAMRIRHRVPPESAIVALSIDAGQRYFGFEPTPVREELAQTLKLGRDTTPFLQLVEQKEQTT